MKEGCIIAFIIIGIIRNNHWKLMRHISSTAQGSTTRVISEQDRFPHDIKNPVKSLQTTSMFMCQRYHTVDSSLVGPFLVTFTFA